MQVEYKKKRKKTKRNQMVFILKYEKKNEDEEQKTTTKSKLNRALLLFYTQKKREKESHFIDFVDDNRLFSLSLARSQPVLPWWLRSRIDVQHRKRERERENGAKLISTTTTATIRWKSSAACLWRDRCDLFVIVNVTVISDQVSVFATVGIFL